MLPAIALHRKVRDEVALQTIVVPTFNHQSCIGSCMDGLKKSLSYASNLIFIDDGSSDDTKNRITERIEQLGSAPISEVLILSNPVPIFETACDNFGFRIAQTEIVIEVQADIAIDQPKFDATYHLALARCTPASAISGRCGHAFDLLVKERPIALKSLMRRVVRSWEAGKVGLTGQRIDGEDISAWRGKIFECETVNRGPWLLLKSDLERHGYLDERNFFLGNDDHDWHRRLYQSEGRRPRYIPTQIHSPLLNGACRRERTGINKLVFDELVGRSGSPEFWTLSIVISQYGRSKKSNYFDGY